MNLSTHLTLRSLRPAGTRARGIPRSWIFDGLKVSYIHAFTTNHRTLLGILRQLYYRDPRMDRRLHHDRRPMVYVCPYVVGPLV